MMVERECFCVCVRERDSLKKIRFACERVYVDDK